MQRHRGFLLYTWTLIVLVASAGWPLAAQTNQERAAGGGKVRTYYVAADEVDWDYAPSGIDQMMNMPFGGMSKFFMEHGPHRIACIQESDLPRIR